MFKVQGQNKQEENMDDHKLINIISSKGKPIKGASDYEFWKEFIEGDEDREGVDLFECSLKEAVEKGDVIKKPKRRKNRGLL